jgi:hypothetical protein
MNILQQRKLLREVSPWKQTTLQFVSRADVLRVIGAESDEYWATKGGAK